MKATLKKVENTKVKEKFDTSVSRQDQKSGFSSSNILKVSYINEINLSEDFILAQGTRSKLNRSFNSIVASNSRYRQRLSVYSGVADIYSYQGELKSIKMQSKQSQNRRKISE